MTVRQLRRALFELPDQDAEVTIAVPVALHPSALGQRCNFVLGTVVEELFDRVLVTDPDIYLVPEREGDLADPNGPDAVYLSIGGS